MTSPETGKRAYSAPAVPRVIGSAPEANENMDGTGDDGIYLGSALG